MAGPPWNSLYKQRVWTKCGPRTIVCIPLVIIVKCLFRSFVRSFFSEIFAFPLLILSGLFVVRDSCFCVYPFVDMVYLSVLFTVFFDMWMSIIFNLVRSTRCPYAVTLGIVLRQPVSSPGYSNYWPPWSVWADAWVCFLVTTVPQPLVAWPWVSYLNLPEPPLPYK